MEPSSQRLPRASSYDGGLHPVGCGLTTPQRATTACQIRLVSMGMIGFDIACETARSGPRMQGYLVNDPRKQQVPISSAPTLLSLRKQQG
jgi:hypothetical protein